MSILNEIAKYTRSRIDACRKVISADEIAKRAWAFQSKLPPYSFEKALMKDGINFICEVKKASPSKGVISEDFPYSDIAAEYENAGADCISCLTEPKYFMGSDEYLREIKRRVNIPVLRKDFTIDEYMIYQAKTLDADCVLLICSLLDKHTLKEYIHLCDALGLSALVEAHDENEISCALECGARIIGVNNRDLKTFNVDVHNSERLRKLVPDNIIFIAESGIKSHSDITVLEDAKVNGVLIGETLMRSKDKKAMLNSLRYGGSSL